MSQNCGPNRMLFREFSAIEDYEGWVIGKLTFCRTLQETWKGNGDAGVGKISEGVRVKKRRRQYAVMEVYHEGCLATMFLMKPETGQSSNGSVQESAYVKETACEKTDVCQKADTYVGSDECIKRDFIQTNLSDKTDISVESNEAKMGKQIACHPFSASEILEFVEEVQDRNTIHRTSHPIVPGLQMVEWFWSLSETTGWESCEFVFREPAYADQRLQIYRESDKYACVAAGTDKILWQAQLVMAREDVAVE